MSERLERRAQDLERATAYDNLKFFTGVSIILIFLARVMIF